MRYKMKNHKLNTGFTLIELLVVIGILAALATVAVLVLNPADLIKQSRDSTRMSDIASLKFSLAVYLRESASLGTSGVTYISIPAANSNCSDLGLPSGSWHCVASSTLKNTDGTGWIPINLGSLSFGSPLSILPVDPNNTTPTSYYTYSTDGSGFVITAVSESTKYSDPSHQTAFTASGGSSNLLGGNFPNGWVSVPGNSTFGTPGFWVMKYEAKCVQASGNTPLTSPDTSYHTYSNSSQPCTGSSYYVASTPDGYPIANISHTTAVSYCSSLGAHLLTNDEWMTISTNAANVSSNWKNGVVGSTESAGGMYRGNSNSSLAMDGTNPLSGTNTRTWILSNGSVIWDIAGNVWEHVQRSTMNSGDLTTTITTPTCSSGTTWCEYAGAGAHITAWNDVSFSAATVGPSNGLWYSAQGIGQVYPATGGASGSVFLRGGNWGSGTYAGAFALFLPWGTTNTTGGVGFRCAR